jgi:hypothetical protein
MIIEIYKILSMHSQIYLIAAKNFESLVFEVSTRKRRFQKTFYTAYESKIIFIQVLVQSHLLKGLTFC